MTGSERISTNHSVCLDDCISLAKTLGEAGSSPVKTEIEYKSPVSPEERTLEFEIRTINFMNTQSLLFIVRDITQLRQVAKLKSLDKYKDMLLASVTHELRTPLNCIIPMITEALDDEDVPEVIKENSLRPSVNSARLLLHIVNDILDYSRFKRNKLRLNFSMFDVKSKLTEIVRLFEIQCKHKNLELCFEYSDKLPREMYGDKDRLGQVIINFLSNSLKFTSKGSITLSVYPSREAEGHAIFKVKDTGIGIRAENMEKLFTEFGKLDAAECKALNPEGVGLGLMISNQLTNMLGSKQGIQVSSVFGIGSEFFFQLPIHEKEPLGIQNEQIALRIPEDKLQSPIKAKTPCNCRRILSVDDNDYNQMVIGRILSKFKFEVLKAYNGAEALTILQETIRSGAPRCSRGDCSSFTVIVTDLHMPIMNGLDLIRHARKLPGDLGRIPIILLSASDEKEQVEEGFKAGMTDFVVKPFTEEMIKTRLRQYKLLE